MEQFRQVGEVLGSLKAMMVFGDDIKINRNQCDLLIEIYNLGFDAMAEEMSQNLRLEEKLTKWKALEQPLRDLHRTVKEGESYVRQCLEPKEWWIKAICLAQNDDCIELHIHNFLMCFSIVVEAMEVAREISGCDNYEIQKKKVLISKKYDRDWLDNKLFQWKFGKQYLVSDSIRKKIEMAWKADRLTLLNTINEKRSLVSNGMKQENRVLEMLSKNFDGLQPSKGKIFPANILVGSKDYTVRRRLGSCSKFKEIQWMGEGLVLQHFFGEIEPLTPEIAQLSTLMHPNLMTFLSAFADEEKKEGFLVMELMNKDLGSYIKEVCGPRKRVPFSLPVAVDIMLQIARGMEYLHSKNIYHGELNPSNILVKMRSTSPDGYLHVKLSGFGLPSVKKFTTRNSTNQPVLNFYIWNAPEVLAEQEFGHDASSKFTEKTDVYSFAMICFELLTGKVPFEDAHLQGEKMSRNIRAGERPLFPSPTPKYLTALTKKCWQAEPSQRPSFAYICRILRSILRFLVMNPDHNQPEPVSPAIDFCDLEGILSRSVTGWGNSDRTPVSDVPFQMFAYRVAERERIALNSRDKTSESGSEESLSACGDDNNVSTEDLFSTAVTFSNMSSISDNRKKQTTKKMGDMKTCRSSGLQSKGRTVRPPQLGCGRSLRMNSVSQLPPIIMNRGRRRISGHVSDSEIA